MTNAPPGELRLIGKLALACSVLLVVAGVLWHGVTVENVQRLWRDLVERPDGPMSFRFVLQPLMASFAAIRDGRNDARTGQAPFFWTLLWDSKQRVPRLQEGLNATARIILLGLVMDVIYQVLVLKTFYPVEAVLIAVVLAFLPYAIIRGPVMRAFSHMPARRAR